MKTPIFSESEKNAILASFLHIALSDTESEKWKETQYSRSFEARLGILHPEEWKYLNNVVKNFGLGNDLLMIVQILEDYKLLVGQFGFVNSLQNLSEIGKDWYIDVAHGLIYADGGMSIQERDILVDIFGSMKITEEMLKNIASKTSEQNTVVTDSIGTTEDHSGEQKEHEEKSQEGHQEENFQKELEYAVLLEKGYKKFNSSSFEESIEYYSQAIKLMSPPRNWAAYFSRGQAKTKLSSPDYEGAKSDLNMVIDMLRTQSNGELYKIFHDPKISNERISEAYYYKGEIFFHEQAWKNSIDDFSDAIKWDMNCINISSAYFNRGKALGMLEMNKEAIWDFDKVINEFASQLTSAELAEMYYSRGCVKASLGEYNSSISDLIESKKLGNNEAAILLEKLVGNNKVNILNTSSEGDQKSIDFIVSAIDLVSKMPRMEGVLQSKTITIETFEAPKIRISIDRMEQNVQAAMVQAEIDTQKESIIMKRKLIYEILDYHEMIDEKMQRNFDIVFEN